MKKPKFKPQLRWATVHSDDGPDEVLPCLATRAELKEILPNHKLMRVLVTAPPKRRMKKQPKTKQRVGEQSSRSARKIVDAQSKTFIRALRQMSGVTTAPK